jgi:hypothetical protein
LLKNRWIGFFTKYAIAPAAVPDKIVLRIILAGFIELVERVYTDPPLKKSQPNQRLKVPMLYHIELSSSWSKLGLLNSLIE